MPTLTYRQLQSALKALRSSGIVVTCKLNSKTAVLQAEYNRLTAVPVAHSVVVYKGYEPSPIGYVPVKRYQFNREDMPCRLAVEPKPYRRVTTVAWTR